MSRLVLRRLGALVVLLYLVLTATFFLVHLAPGDPATILVAQGSPPEQAERLRRVYGLDRPLLVQYGAWLRAVVLSGDWGSSLVHGRPVTRVLGEALPATALLAFAALLVDFGIGVPLGVAAARRRGGAADATIRVGSLLFYSVPLFWLSLMAVLVFAYLVPVLPASHMRSVGADELGGAARLADLLRHLVLPATTLGLASAGGTVRFVRNRMVEVLEQDYVRAARAKGLSERRVIWVHALRNALVPVIQLLGLSLPGLLNGALITEVVFSWPGVGQLTFQSILARDYPLLLGATALTAVLVVMGSFLADLLHAVVDPRVRRRA